MDSVVADKAHGFGRGLSEEGIDATGLKDLRHRSGPSPIGVFDEDIHAVRFCKSQCHSAVVERGQVLTLCQKQKPDDSQARQKAGASYPLLVRIRKACAKQACG